VDVTDVGVPTEGGDVVMDVRAVSTAVSSLSATKSNFNIPIPASYQVGDLLLCYVVTLAQTITSFATNWIELAPVVEETSHPNSLHLYSIGKIAQASESATQSCVFSGGTPMQAITLAIKNPQVLSAQPDATSSVEVGVAGDGTTLPSVTSTLDNDLYVGAVACRYFEGIQDTIDMTGTGITVDYTDTTTRGSQTNCALAIIHKKIPSAGASGTADADVDDAIFARWVGRSMVLFQGNAGGTPGVDASLDVYFRER
jgi:hypothetical protein